MLRSGSCRAARQETSDVFRNMGAQNQGSTNLVAPSAFVWVPFCFQFDTIPKSVPIQKEEPYCQAYMDEIIGAVAEKNMLEDGSPAGQNGGVCGVVTW